MFPHPHSHVTDDIPTATSELANPAVPRLPHPRSAIFCVSNRGHWTIQTKFHFLESIGLDVVGQMPFYLRKDENDTSGDDDLTFHNTFGHFKVIFTNDWQPEAVTLGMGIISAMVTAHGVKIGSFNEVHNIRQANNGWANTVTTNVENQSCIYDCVRWDNEEIDANATLSVRRL